MNKKIEETTEEYERKEGSGLERAGAAAIFFLSPVLSYIMFELVTGNLAAVLPKNAVLNMVWMFALYLLVFGISGSSRISIPVSSVILYVISLAEAFVVSFRSRPIMMGDVLAVKTAMTVAGSYNYTPTFMMIICGILLIVVFEIKKDSYDLPDYAQIMDGYDKLHEDIKAGRVISAYATEANGIAEAVSKMAFGNHLGVKIEHDVDPRDFFAPAWGDIVCEVPADKVGELQMSYRVIGEVTDKADFEYGDVSITLDEALKTWDATLEDVFPTESGVKKEEVKNEVFKADNIVICDHKIGTPTVFIPVFPGTNCEYDSAKAFERAGANVITKVFKNMSAEDIRDSVETYRKSIGQAQIVMFPGGFSAGDEPEGSAKFFATAFRNEVLKDEIMKLLNERDGLMLGICNGFQALIKLGLVPEGKIVEQKPDSPTLTYNTIGRHVSKMVNLKVVSNKSPWLAEAKLGGIYTNPVSHGEGRFVAPKEWIDKLFANGQVATQYVDLNGNPTMDEYWNPNGSFMAIEGITSPDGRVYGKMGHAERRGDFVAKNITGEQDLKLFESGVKYFK